MFVRNQLTYQPPRGEINRLPSMTVPDQSLSVSEILQNHTRGIPYSQRDPQWFGNLEIPDPNSMDLVEIDQWRDEVRLQQEQIERQLTENKRAERRKARKEASQSRSEKTEDTPPKNESDDTDDEERWPWRAKRSARSDKERAQQSDDKRLKPLRSATGEDATTESTSNFGTTSDRDASGNPRPQGEIAAGQPGPKASPKKKATEGRSKTATNGRSYQTVSDTSRSVWHTDYLIYYMPVDTELHIGSTG